MIKLSVIVSTRNREKYLKNAVKSIQNQSLSPELYEILVIDNGSIDNTKQAIKELNKTGKKEVLYYFEEQIGLHNARHRGAKESKGEILLYTDDDIIADVHWLESVLENFEDKKVALAGGKILPKWESLPPEWIVKFWRTNEFGEYLGYLSLLDFREGIKEIPSSFVWGCNFSIRKNVLYECGGFHPDSMPPELIKFRGDGESALASNIEKKHYKIIYNSKSIVYHIIPKEHIKTKYFYKRAFYQGISDSFTEIRQNGNVNNDVSLQKEILLSKIRTFKRLIIVLLKNLSVNEIKNCIHEIIYENIRNNYLKGKIFHQQEVIKMNNLLNYVLKENYY